MKSLISSKSVEVLGSVQAQDVIIYKFPTIITFTLNLKFHHWQQIQSVVFFEMAGLLC